MRESRVLKVKRNIIFSAIQNIVNILITLMGRMVFVYVLDESYLGINGLFSNIFGILSLADLGMGTAMMYHLYKPIAENNQEEIIELISFFKKIYVGIAATVMIIGLLLMPFLPLIINLDHEIPYLYGYYIIALLNSVMSYLFVYRTTLITADQKNYLLSKCIIIFKLIIFLMQTGVLFLFKNYLLYLTVALILNFICNLYQNHIALCQYPYLKMKSQRLSRDKRRAIFQDIKALFVYKICGTIQSNTDNILISIFVGTIAVGYYSNYQLIIAQIVTFFSLIFNNLKASVGNILFDKESSNEEKWFLFNVFELLNYWLVSFCSISFYVLSKGFIEICFGENFVMDSFVVLVIVMNFYTSNIRQTIWIFRETTGIFVQTKYITSVTAAINIILSVIMGYYMGITGILLATVIARMIYAWWKEPKVLFNVYFHRAGREYIKKYILRVILCLVVGMIVNQCCSIISINNVYIKFLFQIFICAFLPNIIFWAVYMRAAEFKFLCKKLLKK